MHATRIPDAVESVSVIMPTLARSQRAQSLRAAVDSVLSQCGVRAIPLIVVNGHEYDRELVAELSARAGVRLAMVPEADLPGALRAGRERVDTPWFAELDDDDLLMPGTLAARLALMIRDPDIDVVVTNGICRGRKGDVPLLTAVPAIAADPLAALARGNWLSPGGALFRSTSVPPESFVGIPRYLEWTCLSLRIAKRCRIAFLDELGFVHRDGAPDSLWHSRECVLGLPRAIRALFAEEPPVAIRHALERRLAGACHAAARTELRNGRGRAAWRWHLQSLAGRHGWRYLPYTTRLLAASLLPAASPR